MPPGADHVFNIYSEIKEDHVLLPDECYPKWLWELEKPEKSYGELAMMFIYGQVAVRGQGHPGYDSIGGLEKRGVAEGEEERRSVPCAGWPEVREKRGPREREGGGFLPRICRTPRATPSLFPAGHMGLGDARREKRV